jgi:hypothetical protein
MIFGEIDPSIPETLNFKWVDCGLIEPGNEYPGLKLVLDTLNRTDQYWKNAWDRGSIEELEIWSFFGL